MADVQLILDDTLCNTDSTPSGENFRERFIKALVCIRSYPHSKSDTVCTMGKWMILGDGKPGLLCVWPCGSTRWYSDTLYSNPRVLKVQNSQLSFREFLPPMGMQERDG